MRIPVLRCHPLRWLLPFIVSLFLVSPVLWADPGLTQIDDVLYRADGTRAGGTLVISWPAFTAANKEAVAAGSKTFRIANDGRISVGLVPTAGATPSGVVYKVVAKYDDGTTSTEYWSVPATPTANIASMRTVTSAVSGAVASQTAINGKLDRMGDTPVSLAGQRFASSFAGATGTNKLDAAIADCGTNPCIVVAPSTLGSGTATTMPDNVVIRDERQWATLDTWGLPNQGRHNGISWQRRISSTRDGWDGYSTAHFYFEAAKGGHNYWNGSTGAKNSYNVLGTATVARTPGQVLGNVFGVANYSSGDTLGAAVSTRRYGGTLANGDEGQKVLRIDGGSGDALFTATISAVTGNTLTFTSSSWAYTLGETRLLINRNQAKKRTASCVVSTSATPPTVTCSDASLATWYGTGTKTNVCFELDSTKVNEFNRVVRVRSIQSQTQATLDVTYAGNDGIWDNGSVGIPSTGTATFTNCSPVTDASQWAQNKVVVADGTNFATGDPIEESVGAEQGFTGISLLYYPSVWPTSRTTMLHLHNAASKMDGTPTIPIYSYITTSGARTGAAATRFMWTHFNGTVKQGGILWHNESTTPPPYPWFAAFSDNTSGCEGLLGTYNSALSNLTSLQYCRSATDAGARGWRMGVLALTEDGRFALTPDGYNGGNPSNGNQFLVTVTGNNNGFIAHNSATGTGQAFIARTSTAAASWQVDFNGNEKHFSGSKLTMYSDGGSSATSVIDGSTGTAQFAKVCYNSAQTLCDFAGTGAPTSACTTGSTYRRSDGGANTTFYVCEAGQWKAK